jgi:hypothetical protein
MHAPRVNIGILAPSSLSLLPEHQEMSRFPSPYALAICTGLQQAQSNKAKWPWTENSKLWAKINLSSY